MNQLDVVQLGAAPSPGLRAAQQLVSSCIQCGTCSSTCPTAPAMDYTPRHLWRMVEAGLTDEVLNSSAFWFCTSCYACTNQCPRGIHPGQTMLRLKQAVAEGEGGVMPENMARFGHTVVEYHNISAEPNDTRHIWMENLDERERPADRVGRRDAKVLYTNVYFETDLADVTFSGYIDMIREHPQEGIQIIVFNTSSQAPSPAFLSRGFDISLMAYALWKSEVYPQYPETLDGMEFNTFPSVRCGTWKCRCPNCSCRNA